MHISDRERPCVVCGRLTRRIRAGWSCCAHHRYEYPIQAEHSYPIVYVCAWGLLLLVALLGLAVWRMG